MLGRARGLEMFADWTDRIAAGEVPPAPPRPQGIERNLVLTMWDWGGPATFAHDELTTDKRNPTANAYGPIYGVDWGNDGFLIARPAGAHRHRAAYPGARSKRPPGKAQSMPVPSPYWGDKLYWFDPAITNHAAMDSKGRVWMSSRFRVPENQPCVLRDPSVRGARAAADEASGRSSTSTRRRGNSSRSTSASTCITCSLRAMRTKRSTATARSAAQSAGSTRASSRRPATRGGAGLVPPWYRRQQRREESIRAVDRADSGGRDLQRHSPPDDGSVWGAVPGPMPGKIVRHRSEDLRGRSLRAAVRSGGRRRRLHAARHRRRFERRHLDGAGGQRPPRELRPAQVQGSLQGPAATDGQHCREGWTLHPVPGPRFKGVRGDVAVDFQYYNFVDRFNTFGLGANCRSPTARTRIRCSRCSPTAAGSCLRVPYPLGFFSRGMDGRIDDPNAGWKGRALYADYGPNAVWHVEGGLGTRSAVVKFQLRPDPLAK